MLFQYNVHLGSFAGVFSIQPTHTGVLTRQNIADELGTQIANRKLPSRTNNSLYIVQLPPGQPASDFQGNLLCSATATSYCAYHASLLPKTNVGGSIRFVTMPDFSQGSCATGCGADPDPANDFTALESHEIFEAVTDPDGNAWKETASAYSPNNEIGDLCNGEQGKIFTGPSFSGESFYVVQKLWSNSAHGCTASSRGFRQVPGCAVAIGSGGPVPWVLGCDAVVDHSAWKWTGTNWQFMTANAGVAIAVAPDGTPWVVDHNGTIMKFDSSSRSFFPNAIGGCASPSVGSIAVGANDDAWVLGCDSTNDKSIWHLNNNGFFIESTFSVWNQVGGGAVKIALETFSGISTPWVVSFNGRIFTWNGSAFNPAGSLTTGLSSLVKNPVAALPGCALDIAASAKGRAIIGCGSSANQAIFTYRAYYPGWDQLLGAAVEVAVTTDGTPWVVDNNGNIYVLDQFGCPSGQFCEP